MRSSPTFLAPLTFVAYIGCNLPQDCGLDGLSDSGTVEQAVKDCLDGDETTDTGAVDTNGSVTEPTGSTSEDSGTFGTPVESLCDDTRNAVVNRVFTVNDLGDGQQDACTPDQCTLRSAVLSAVALGGATLICLPEGTITLSTGGAEENDGREGDLDIHSAQVIVVGMGAGPTLISAGSTGDRIFDVSFGALDLDNVHLTGGYASDGGAIQTSSSDLHVRNSVFSNNAAYYSGGAISVFSTGDRGEVLIESSIFEQNSAYYDGGAIHLFAEGSNIVECNFIENTSDSSGGAISAFSSDGLSIQSSYFGENESEYHGGGAYISNSITTITNTTWYRNSAEQGGALSVGSEPVYVNNSTFVENEGGAFYVSFADAYLLGVRGSLFSNNRLDGVDTACANGLTSHGLNIESGQCADFTDTTDLSGEDPVLYPAGPTLSPGSSTYTIPPLSYGSPAVDSGSLYGFGLGGPFEIPVDQDGTVRDVNPNRGSTESTR